MMHHRSVPSQSPGLWAVLTRATALPPLEGTYRT